MRLLVEGWKVNFCDSETLPRAPYSATDLWLISFAEKFGWENTKADGFEVLAVVREVTVLCWFAGWLSKMFPELFVLLKYFWCCGAP